MSDDAKIKVLENGPLLVSGADLCRIGIERNQWDRPYRYSDARSVEHNEQYALCRCGASANKPFCDGAHEKAGFVDYGAVGEKGDGLKEEGGRLEVKRIPNGPILVRGNFSIVSAGGRVAWQGDRAALCRCGASKNKPFCDGQHSEIGFEAD